MSPRGGYSGFADSVLGHEGVSAYIEQYAATPFAIDDSMVSRNRADLAREAAALASLVGMINPVLIRDYTVQPSDFDAFIGFLADTVFTMGANALYIKAMSFRDAEKLLDLGFTTSFPHAADRPYYANVNERLADRGRLPIMHLHI